MPVGCSGWGRRGGRCGWRGGCCRLPACCGPPGGRAPGGGGPGCLRPGGGGGCAGPGLPPCGRGGCRPGSPGQRGAWPCSSPAGHCGCGR
ncbi:hypothetical protein FCN18_01450 [Prauserella endophytica]|uniref:Uncharacterized protein n=1 Tax=Prauserella endophytica TaxID=1592324 RepID=A0ABY2SC37_9PSEU|nr:hypothetical protein FCN18_01450 [Prauserella endophytica]